MPMQMGFRWYGEGNDSISLADIKQIPGVTSIVWALHHKQPGEIWEKEEIAQVQKQLEPYGFNMDVVESVNVHDDIKAESEGVRREGDLLQLHACVRLDPHRPVPSPARRLHRHVL